MCIKVLLEIFKKKPVPELYVKNIPIKTEGNCKDMTKQEFILKISPAANSIFEEFRIKPVILITQAAHESGWGNSGLTKDANNLFGFTGESWEKAGKPVIKLPTKEYIKGKWETVNRPFRKYESWLESARDWASLIHGLERYKTAFAYAMTGDVENYSIYVAKAGYATDPGYAEKLIKVSVEVKNLGV